MLGAPLIAAAQVIVYIGAISVLILFAIMLTQTKDAPSRLVFQTQAVPGGRRRDHHRGRHRTGGRRDGLGCGRGRSASRPTACRRLLFNDFVLPFEIVSVLLLAAVIGGVFLAKRERAGRREQLASTPISSCPGCCSPSARSASSPAATRSAC